MQRNIAHCGGISPFVAEGYTLQTNIPGKDNIFIFLHRFGHPVGVHHFPYPVSGHFGMGVHHQRKRRHNNAVHHQRHILHHGKNIAAGSGGNAAFHPAAAKVQNSNRH